MSVSVADWRKRIAINFLDHFRELWRVEERSFDVLGILLEPFVGAEACAGRTAKLATNGLFFVDDEFHRAFDQLMVIFLSRQTGSVGLTFGGAQNVELRFSNCFAILIHPGERIVAFMRSHVGEHTSGRVSVGLWASVENTTGGSSVISLFESWVSVDGVLPNLVSVGCEVDFGVGVAIQDAGLFVVKIDDCCVVPVIFKKRFVSADDFVVFLKPLPHARA